jgi:HSP20 family molecular chaperone IbpA
MAGDHLSAGWNGLPPADEKLFSPEQESVIMENTNINQPPGKTCGTRIFASLVLLAIGVLIGWAGTYYWHGSARGATRSAAASAGGQALAVQPATITTGAPQFSQWDPVQQMSQMQAQIDQMFQRSFAQFRTNAATTALPAIPGYSLSMDVRDMKDKYQVRAFLPDTKASDVKVNLKGDELKVDVANKTTEKATARNGETAMTEWGNYEEVVPLSGPLKSDKMKIERMPHELIISVPKA